MIEQLKPAILGLIIDMDGVLWKDETPIGNLASIFRRIQERGLKVALATNNATRTPDEYLVKLQTHGVSLEAWQIVTSAAATAHALSQRFPGGGTVFVVGENGVITALHEHGFIPISDPENETQPLAVVAGFDRSLTYKKLARATLHIRAGTPFYGTNPDKTFPTPDGLVPGAGSILACLEAATSVEPIVVGKPEPFMLELAAQRMGLTRQEVLVVGDRLETDIAGGQKFQARTGLVLSGVSTLEQAKAWSPEPDLIAENLAQLIQ